MMPNFLLAVINFYNDLYPDKQDQDKLLAFIDSKFTEPLGDVRSESDFTIWLCKFVLALCMEKASQLYGEMDAKFAICEDPNLFDSPRSRIAPTMDSESHFVVCLGSYINDWEDFFYDTCHEAIHTLNPVFDVSNNPASALDEGVAVKFAECMYNLYIRPYNNRSAVSSPLISIAENNYRIAFRIASKIPDSLLCDIRQEFSSFGKIDDVHHFTELTEQYLNHQEIEFISNHFAY